MIPVEIPAYWAWGEGQEFPVSETVTKETWLKMKNNPKPTSDPSISQIFLQIFLSHPHLILFSWVAQHSMSSRSNDRISNTSLLHWS